MSGRGKFNLTKMKQYGKKYGKLVAEKAAEMNAELDRTLNNKALENAFSANGESDYIEIHPEGASTMPSQLVTPAPVSLSTPKPISRPKKLALPRFGTPSTSSLPQAGPSSSPATPGIEDKTSLAVPVEEAASPVDSAQGHGKQAENTPEPEETTKPSLSEPTDPAMWSVQQYSKERVAFMLAAVLDQMYPVENGEEATAEVDEPAPEPENEPEMNDEEVQQTQEGSHEPEPRPDEQTAQHEPELMPEAEPHPGPEYQLETAPAPEAEPEPEEQEQMVPAQALWNAETTIERLNERLHVANKVTDALQQTIEELENKMKAGLSTRQADALKKEMTLTLETEQRRGLRFKAASEEQAKQIAQLKEGLAKAAEVEAQSHEELESVRIQLTKAEDDLSAAESDMRAWKAKAGVLASDVSSQRELVAQRDATIAELRALLTRKAEQQQKLNEDASATANRRVAGVKAELEAAQKAIEEEKARYAQLEQQLEMARAEADELRDRAVRGEQVAIGRAREVASATAPLLAEVQKVTGLYNQEQAARAAANRELDRARAALESSEAQWGDRERTYRAEIDTAHAAAAAEAERVQEVEADLAALAVRLAEARADHGRTAQSEADLKARVEALEKAAEEAKSVQAEKAKAEGKDLQVMFEAALDLIAEHEATIAKLTRHK
ncbi:Chromosome partition protein Smc [Carpediemonas membranifera]|uniref:Chromosome partition protein Smc n=1 Tax=Carpediemonas membranifera TaxID=201153 RepID=A0A8J6C0Q0_9EUKA|nr:Chromosome partition protein Smc [Carpediemonas membranifera]|eukprot:KAG9396816.1 Chromosome partition protein Smc [Carpediemonas membranifera]